MISNFLCIHGNDLCQFSLERIPEFIGFEYDWADYWTSIKIVQWITKHKFVYEILVHKILTFPFRYGNLLGCRVNMIRFPLEAVRVPLIFAESLTAWNINYQKCGKFPRNLNTYIYKSNFSKVRVGSKISIDARVNEIIDDWWSSWSSWSWSMIMIDDHDRWSLSAKIPQSLPHTFNTHHHPPTHHQPLITYYPSLISHVKI